MVIFGEIKIRINRIIVRRNGHDGLCLKQTRQKSDAHPNIIHSRRNICHCDKPLAVQNRKVPCMNELIFEMCHSDS